MLHKQNSYNTMCTLTKCQNTIQYAPKYYTIRTKILYSTHQNTIQYAPKTIVYGVQLALHNTGKWLNMSGFYLDIRKQCRDGI